MPLREVVLVVLPEPLGELPLLGRLRLFRPPVPPPRVWLVSGSCLVPNSPLIDTYLVPEAPQGARSARYRHTAHHRP